jgi:hypothetical protein
MVTDGARPATIVSVVACALRYVVADAGVRTIDPDEMVGVLALAVV